MQILFETDDLETVLWAELLAVLLRYKRAKPYMTGRDKGKGGIVRGACMLRPELQQPELDFIAAALQHLPTLPKMTSDIPSAKCLSAELVKALSGTLREKITTFPKCVENHLLNACFYCGIFGHYTRHCKVIYSADELDRDHYIDKLDGQEEREEKAHLERAELKQKRKEEEEKKAKAKKKAKSKAKSKAKKTTTGVRKTIEKKEPRFGGVKRCGTPKSEVVRPCHEFNEEDRCTTCKRKRVNKGGGSAYTRKKAKKKKRRRRKKKKAKKKAKKKKRKARVKKFKVKRCTKRGLKCTFVMKVGGYRECKKCKRRPPH